MIGNDIIDLQEVSSSPISRRKRFLDKVFTIEEQDFLLTQNDANSWIWLLWSMKESAWKAHYRNSLIRTFSPKLMQCNTYNFSIESDFISGIVALENKVYYTLSYWKDDLIHTVANATAVPVEYDFFSFSSYNQSLQVRKKVCETISNHLGCALDEVTIDNNAQGVPQILVNGIISNIKLSISHHGRFGAYAFGYEHNKND